MHVVILYNRVAVHDSADDLDVLQQVVAVEQSLLCRRHTVVRLSCDLRLDEVRSVLKRNIRTWCLIWSNALAARTI